MTDPEIRRTEQVADASKLDAYRRQVEQDLPELREQAVRTETELRAAARIEPTVSGQLRRAISESGIDPRDLAARSGLSPKTLAEFLLGTAALDSVAVDKLAAILKQELRPVG